MGTEKMYYIQNLKIYFFKSNQLYPKHYLDKIVSQVEFLHCHTAAQRRDASEAVVAEI